MNTQRFVFIVIGTTAVLAAGLLTLERRQLAQARAEPEPGFVIG
jgi:hypothetical protein